MQRLVMLKAKSKMFQNNVFVTNVQTDKAELNLSFCLATFVPSQVRWLLRTLIVAAWQRQVNAAGGSRSAFCRTTGMQLSCNSVNVFVVLETRNVYTNSLWRTVTKCAWLSVTIAASSEVIRLSVQLAVATEL